MHSGHTAPPISRLRYILSKVRLPHMLHLSKERPNPAVFMLSSRNFIRIVLEAAFFSSNALRVFNASNKSCGSD